MPRSKRTVIDNAADYGFANYGTDWYDRGVEQTYTADPIAPQDDWTTLWLPAPIRLPSGAVIDTVTMWGRGLVTFGAPTEAQRAYMATLTDTTDLHAFLEGIPGGYIDAGFQATAYGAVEHGDGAHDFVANPFGTFQDPQNPNPSGLPVFDHGQARGYAYVTFAGDPYEGSSQDYDGVEEIPIGGPDGGASVEFSDEGFRIGAQGGQVHFDGTDFAVNGNGFVYYSELNPVVLTAAADVAGVAGGPEQLIGGAGDDRLTGGAYADRLDGGDDNDVLVGGGGIDRLFGGDGDDDLSDGDEQGYLSGGAGNDVLRPGGGEDTVDGGDGTDRVVFDYSGWGGAIGFTLDPAKSDYLLPGDLYKSIVNVEAVTFSAGGGDDTLKGAGSDDVLTGGGGQDGLFGGDGNDTLSGGDDHDYLEGAAGDDWLDGGTGFGPTIFNVGTDNSVYDLDTTPYLLVRASEYSYYPGSAGWYSDFNFTVSSLTQSLSFDLSSTGGDDAAFYVDISDANGHLVYSSYFSGSTIVYFDQFGYDDGSGNWVQADPGRFAMSISTTDDAAAQVSVGLILSGVPIPDGDTMVGGIGDDTYVVDSLYDRVLENAGEGRDTIVTSLAAYSLAALPEIERLFGDASAQTLTGNASDNAIRSGGGADTLDGAGGDDRLTIAGVPAHVEGGTGVDTLVIAAGASIALSPDSISGIERVLVQDGATLDMSAFAAPLVPLRSVSSVDGGATIIGTGGEDRIFGGDGADTLAGGGGADRMIGGLGDDLYRVDAPGDGVIEKAAGGFDTVEAAIDWTLGRNLEALVLGEGGAIAGTGNKLGNVLTGNANANLLSGLAGDDVLIGGGGRDELSGGKGRDVFQFDATIARTQADADCVTDFAHASDRLDLTRVGQFTFIGGAAFGGHVGELRYEYAGKTTIVSGDLDGDGAGDVFVQLKGRVALDAGDLILADPAAHRPDGGSGEGVHAWLAAHSIAPTVALHMMLV